MLFKEIIAVYIETHTKHVNTKSSVADCERRWYIYLPLCLKGLIWNTDDIRSVTVYQMIKFTEIWNFYSD
jgi:hypothetical protein